MREILFRGKRIDNGEWVEGYYAIKGKGTDLERHYIISSTFDSNTKAYPFYFTDIEVGPETVCQYTGLTDKGSRKIWENDIIRYNKKLFRVAWEADCTHFAAYPLDKEIRYAPCLNIGTMKSVEVVGNIFDNPDSPQAIITKN